jgi:hypothetical protein
MNKGVKLNGTALLISAIVDGRRTDGWQASYDFETLGTHETMGDRGGEAEPTWAYARSVRIRSASL